MEESLISDDSSDEESEGIGGFEHEEQDNEKEVILYFHIRN